MNKKIIFFGFFLFIFAVIVVFSIAFSRKSSLQNQNEKTSSPRSEPAQLPKEDMNIIFERKDELIDKYGEDSYDTVKHNPAIESLIKKIKGDFILDELGVSSPSSVTALSSGEKLIVLRGCTEDYCGGTVRVIAIDEKLSKVYMLSENWEFASGFEILGNPSDEIRTILEYFYMYK